MTPVPIQTQDGIAGQKWYQFLYKFSCNCEAINNFTLSTERFFMEANRGNVVYFKTYWET